MRIESELVDAVIAGKAKPQKFRDSTDLLCEVVAGLVCLRFGTGSAPMMINLADDRGDLIGRRAGAGFGEQRRVLTRRLSTVAGAPLRRSAPCIRM
jgi:hypothetical protein